MHGYAAAAQREPVRRARPLVVDDRVATRQMFGGQPGGLGAVYMACFDGLAAIKAACGGGGGGGGGQEEEDPAVPSVLDDITAASLTAAAAGLQRLSAFRADNGSRFALSDTTRNGLPVWKQVSVGSNTRPNSPTDWWVYAGGDGHWYLNNGDEAYSECARVLGTAPWSPFPPVGTGWMSCISFGPNTPKWTHPDSFTITEYLAPFVSAAVRATGVGPAGGGPILRLPDSVLAHIFEMLPFVHSQPSSPMIEPVGMHRELLLAVPSVCRRFRNVCKTAVTVPWLSFQWAGTEASGKLTPTALMASLGRFHCVSGIDLTFLFKLTPEAVATCAVLGQSLRAFHLWQCGDRAEAGLGAVLSGCRNLREVVITAGEAPAHAVLALGGLHNLEKLQLQSKHRTTNELLAAIGAGCPMLRSLNLNHCSGFTSDGFHNLALGCRHITHLDLGFTSNSMDGSYAADEEPCVTDETFADFVCYLQQLESLNVSGCHAITEIGIFLAATRCANLRHLDADFCPRVTNSWLARGGMIKDHVAPLRTLRISRSNLYRHAAAPLDLGWIMEKYPQLTLLKVVGHTLGPHWEAQARRFPQLEIENSSWW